MLPALCTSGSHYEPFQPSCPPAPMAVTAGGKRTGKSAFICTGRGHFFCRHGSDCAGAKMVIAVVAAGVTELAGAGAGGGRWRLCQDRKSTRLNSSHVKISYAVFCLKKKKS